VDSGFGNSIYWTLPVATTITHLKTLQEVNQELYLLSSGFRTALPGSRIFISVFLSHAEMWTPGLSLLWVSSSQSQSYVATDGHLASLSWYEAPIWGLRPDLYFCQTVACLLMWSALSDERTGLSFSRVTVSSDKPVVSMQNLHFTCY
jgi:hypothetical protein